MVPDLFMGVGGEWPLFYSSCKKNMFRLTNAESRYGARLYMTDIVELS